MFNPYKEKDTTRLIWDYRYQCRVPAMDLISDTEMQLCGHYTTGDSEIDKMMMTDYRTVWLNIDQMVEFYRNDVVVRVYSDSDIKLIYDSISAHLLAWVDRVRNGINVNTAPFGDLILMDRFATEIYEKAKYHITDEVVECFMTKMMVDLSTFSASQFYHPSFMRKLEYAKKNPNMDFDKFKPPVEVTEYQDRESLAEHFSRYLSGRQFL